MSSASYEIERGQDVFEIDIDYTMTPFVPAQLYGLPEDCYPAEGGDIDALDAFYEGKPFPLTPDETAAVETFIYRTHTHGDPDYD